MPVIHVELWEGRPTAVRDAIAEDITASVVKHLGVLPEATLLQVLAVLQEMFAP